MPKEPRGDIAERIGAGTAKPSKRGPTKSAKRRKLPRMGRAALLLLVVSPACAAPALDKHALDSPGQVMSRCEIDAPKRSPDVSLARWIEACMATSSYEFTLSVACPDTADHKTSDRQLLDPGCYITNQEMIN